LTIIFLAITTFIINTIALLYATVRLNALHAERQKVLAESLRNINEGSHEFMPELYNSFTTQGSRDFYHKAENYRKVVTIATVLSCSSMFFIILITFFRYSP
jgi:hypothetical protein